MHKILTVLLISMTTPLYAIPSINFEHKDWQLVCDNTGTCRAVGYGASEEYFTIMIEREAGEQSEPKVYIKTALMDIDWFDSLKSKSRSLPDTAELWLNGQKIGKFTNSGANATSVGDFTLWQGVALTAEQSKAIISSLKGKTDLRYRLGNFNWAISDAGSTAVLLKMDEFQKRVGKPTALIRPGNDRSAVLAPQVKPQVKAAPVSSEKSFVIKSGTERYNQIRQLIKDAHSSQCSDWISLDDDNEYGMLDFEITPLNHELNLVSTSCWTAAYNGGSFFAVLNKDLSKLVQTIQTDDYYGYIGYQTYQNGELSAQNKGRGIGDCWVGTTAQWNGKTFEKTTDWTSGLCRGYPGGAWHLPEYVAEMIPAK
ncbi:uncharacterized protein DUF1176 [Cricetibacter osteomyelitidis]|uniref:Uncharacterized protein DUF1176 n=1 Tax=Cricetibacter osteomyelitidis TaxID=1521931 RepID=A0A4R2SQ31_9PAST|nr:DUF1176 domain-containing protein [Cricetibacter osteomyelitidis]TCP91185.1 uncharacterized protein DUF1176 [Cricetibacter osteomyelitidis]